MTVYLQDTDLTLHHGDCLEVLRTLPDRSVHMCATSPPFYGLRDYGTGLWEGGDPDCDHKRMETRLPHERKSSTLGGGTDTVRIQEEAFAVYKTDCGKCGARRVDQQIGLEETPDQWVERLVAVFREVRRVLRDDGTLWVEIGDSYCANQGAGFDTHQNGDRTGARASRVSPTVNRPNKPKDLLGQPWLLAFALRADGWYLRSEIIWARPNPMPESVTDRPTKSHSTVFLLSKRPRYFYDADAIRETPLPQYAAPSDGVKEHGAWAHPDESHVRRFGDTTSARNVSHPAGANARSVWTIPTEPTPFAHFATWPRKLVARMILAGTSERGCCSECGAPWVRDVEESESDYARLKREQGHEWTDMDAAALERGTITQSGEGGQTRNANGTVPHLKPRTGRTLGWRASCSCGTGDVPEVRDDDVDKESLRGALPVLRPHLAPVPAVVLDPFAGSGTTLLVARQHGRHSIGIELNESYCELVRDRTSQQSLLADVS